MTSVTTPLLITQCPGALIWWLEDDRALCRLVSPRLQDCGWRVVVFHRFVKLQWALQQEEPDLLLLELRIPGDLAVPSLRSWRRQGLACPVLILSGLADAVHRIDGLAAGANDYLAKPFHLAELTWRIEHLLVSSQPRRLSQHAMERPIPLGPLILEPARGCVRSPHGEEFRLTRGDLALLLALVSQPLVVHSRRALLRASGSLVDSATSRSLDVRLSRLRRLLRSASAGAVGITSVRGQGYRLELSPCEQGGNLKLPALVLGTGLGLIALQGLLTLPAPAAVRVTACEALMLQGSPLRLGASPPPPPPLNTS
jgi:DNA-binding response OmpR family regulator